MLMHFIIYWSLYFILQSLNIQNLPLHVQRHKSIDVPLQKKNKWPLFSLLQDDDFSSLYTEEELPDQLFALPPIRDEWRALFDLFDPEGFGEIPLADFEVALDSREFITNISPGKLIILKDKLIAHRQMGVSAITFQEFVNTLSGKRTLSFKCAVHAKDKQVSYSNLEY